MGELRRHVRSNHRRYSIKKLFSKNLQYSQENTRAEVSFLIKILTQVFSCEYCQIFKNTYFEEHLRKTASDMLNQEDIFTLFYNILNSLKLFSVMCEQV